MSIRVVQCCSTGGERIVCLVTGDTLSILQGYGTLYEFVNHSIRYMEPLEGVLLSRASDRLLDYESIYGGTSDWTLLPPFDHPTDASHCFVTGTGLSHRKSAENRQAMHSGDGGESVTDSMRMYRLGEAGGRPAPGEIGTPPEWFWKGDGAIIRAHGACLDVPNYAEDGGEEAEIAGVYIIGPQGEVCRVGFAAGNEFSDHVMESQNYLFLAPSKLRQCSLGPEIVVGGTLDDVSGTSAVLRDGCVIWQQEIKTGELNMVHSLANLEHHHFKYETHRRPGDVHIHFLGTPGFSFGSGLKLQDDDVMSVYFKGFGRPLRNSIQIERTPPLPITVVSL